MKFMFCAITLGLITLPLSVHLAYAWQTTAATAAQKDSSYIDSNGTAHVTRVIPLPQTVSVQARKKLARPSSDAAPQETLEQKRAHTDASAMAGAQANRSLYPVNIASSAIAGVPVKIVTPLGTVPADKQKLVLINIHGGGFTTDSGSLTESIPIANLTRTKVVSVLYRLAPEHPFPAAVEDVVAVYRELLKTYKPQDTAIYGTSAGAILTAEVAVELKRLGLALPAALGIFTGAGDFSKIGDSQAMYTVSGLAGYLDPAFLSAPWLKEYVGHTSPRDPILSPVYADLQGMPPTLFVTSTRDLLLSGTVNLHRAFLQSGVDAKLVVFDGLNHAFWYDASLPEAREADEMMARFFSGHLGKASGH